MYWLIVPMTVLAAAAAWAPASFPIVESTAAPLPVVAAMSAVTGDTSVPNASEVLFKDDGLQEAAPTF
jgi:hypothetical protein